MRKSLAVLVLGIVASCGLATAAVALSEPSVVGSYALSTVNGNIVPASLGNGVEALGGTIVLKADLSYTDERRVESQGSAYVWNLVGSYSVKGDTITLITADSTQGYKMSVTAKSLTGTWPEGVFVYVR